MLGMTTKTVRLSFDSDSSSEGPIDIEAIGFICKITLSVRDKETGVDTEYETVGFVPRSPFPEDLAGRELLGTFTTNFEKPEEDSTLH